MILITGAAGFIGSALIQAQNRGGNSDLILCDHFGSGEKWKNILGLRFHSFVDDMELLDWLKSDPLSSEIETVLHMGACTDTAEEDSDYLFQNNTLFTQRLCQWSLDSGVRFIYASSAAVYGDGSFGFSDEDSLTPKLRPLNPYGFSKWLSDMWLIHQNLTERVVGLRFFNVFGPNEHHKGKMASVLHQIFPLAQKEGLIRLFKSHRSDCKDGEQRRDFIYVKDVADAVQFFIDNPNVGGIFNIGTGIAHTFNELANAIFKTLDIQGRIEYFPMPEAIREKYQYFTQADVSHLRNAGYSTEFTLLDEAVSDYVQKYLLKLGKRLS